MYMYENIKEASMKLNVGGFDKLVRIVAGLGLLVSVFVLQGNLRWFGLIGVVPLVTGLIGYCPLYSLFGLSTCPAKTRLA
jgi:cytochrome c oxidase subunit IV